jgi:hypothetical protein
MSLNRLQMIVVASWFAVLIAVLGGGAAFGVPFTVGQGVAMLLAGLIPAAVLLGVFRGAPPKTIAQVLYDLEQMPIPAPASMPLPDPRTLVP